MIILFNWTKINHYIKNITDRECFDLLVVDFMTKIKDLVHLIPISRWCIISKYFLHSSKNIHFRHCLDLDQDCFLGNHRGVVRHQRPKSHCSILFEYLFAKRNIDIIRECL